MNRLDVNSKNRPKNDKMGEGNIVALKRDGLIDRKKNTKRKSEMESVRESTRE